METDNPKSTKTPDGDNKIVPINEYARMREGANQRVRESVRAIIARAETQWRDKKKQKDHLLRERGNNTPNK